MIVGTVPDGITVGIVPDGTMVSEGTIVGSVPVGMTVSEGTTPEMVSDGTMDGSTEDRDDSMLDTRLSTGPVGRTAVPVGWISVAMLEAMLEIKLGRSVGRSPAIEEIKLLTSIGVGRIPEAVVAGSVGPAVGSVTPELGIIPGSVSDGDSRGISSPSVLLSEVGIG
jgi:hypothetical protein